MHQFAKETISTSLEEEMRRSYLDYAMSVIVGRALPDVRDGLKPVHRRVLYSMYQLSNDWNRPYKKSARIVGDVIGKYHPHGDQSVYDAIVRMAQEFSLRYLLIDGQGNFGSVDGDSAAAMRYTETRISKIGHELLIDLDQETVDYVSNYDGNENEPTILPARFPNLIVNGSSGIAVGMATNIPPHNLGEVIDGCRYLLLHPESSIDDLFKFIPAPDFPTAGIIYGIEGVREGYKSGRGKVLVRARTHFEEVELSQRESIIVDELPYQVNKRALLERIAELIQEKRILGISNIRDESDKSGMRIVIELKRGEVSEIVLNNLFKYTQLQDTFGINMVALVDGQPRLLNLKEILSYFLSYRREVVTRRTKFQLSRARERCHMLEGLSVAIANISDFIQIIRSANTPVIAKQKLISRAWDTKIVRSMLVSVEELKKSRSDLFQENGVSSVRSALHRDSYKLSDIQAQEILQMRLQKLTGLEQNSIFHEYLNVTSEICNLLDILARPERITEIIDIELKKIKSEFSDVRRSHVEYNASALNAEDFITPQEMVVTMSHAGYIKSQPLSEYRSQKRGGRGRQATLMKNEDWIETLFVANTHDYVLCFSNRGRVYWVKVYELPQGSRNARGRPAFTVFPLEEKERINVVLPVKVFTSDRYVFMATSFGTVKKTPLEAFSRPLRKGIIAIDLQKGDHLIGVAITDGNHDVMLFSNAGKAVRFSENDVRPMGREARGVRGMQFSEGQAIIAMLVAHNDEEQSILTVTENGFGKRTPICEYTRHARGTKGIIAIQTSRRNGRVVGATLVHPEREIMLITTAGILIRTRVSEIREMGRVTQGVKLIDLDEDTYLSSLHQIAETEGDIKGKVEMTSVS